MAEMARALVVVYLPSTHKRLSTNRIYRCVVRVLKWALPDIYGYFWLSLLKTYFPVKHQVSVVCGNLVFFDETISI